MRSCAGKRERAAKERALLVLRSWKEDQDEDPAWRRTMPADQAETVRAQRFGRERAWKAYR